MANLTNSGKLIEKFTSIDAKIWSIPEWTDVGSELSDIKNTIGDVADGKTVVDLINDVDTKADGIASDLSDFEDEVEDTYAKKADLTTVYKYRSSVEKFEDLPTSGNVVGDVYDVQTKFVIDDKEYEAGTNVAWNGTSWDPLGGRVDLSNYYTKAEIDAKVAGEAYTKVEINAMSGLSTASAGFEAVDVTVDGTTKQASAADVSNQSIDGALKKDNASIKALIGAYNAVEDRMDTAESDISNRYTKAEINTITGLTGASAGFTSKKVTETAATDKTSVATADNVDLKTALSNISDSVSVLSNAHNDVTDRVATAEEDIDTLESKVSAIETALPADLHFIDVTLTGKVTELSNENITAKSHISFVVTSGDLNGYTLEKRVEAGKVTFTSPVAETATLEVLVINKKAS